MALLEEKSICLEFLKPENQNQYHLMEIKVLEGNTSELRSGSGRLLARQAKGPESNPSILQPHTQEKTFN
jgi:hypothetical protein